MTYKRGRVYWYRFRWTVKLEDGTKQRFMIQKSARTSNSRKATEVEEEHRRALRLGYIHPLDPWPRPPAPQAPKLRDFADRFREHVKLHTKPGTARFYGEALDRVEKFAPLADRVLTDITGEIVSKYVAWRRAAKDGNTVITINGELRTIRRMLNLAKEWGILETTPSLHELPGAKGRERVLSFKEEAVYLRAAYENFYRREWAMDTTSPTLHDAAIIAVDTGIRPDSELFRLRWEHVYLEISEDAPNGYLHVCEGKTENAVRNVPLTPRAREVLLRRKSLDSNARYVFSGSGRKGHITSLRNSHTRAVRTAGLEPFEFYCWRHTFGTRCAESGMDKFTLARLMGHSSPRVAERYYVHVTEPHVTAGFERFVSYHTERLIEVFPAQSSNVQ